MKAEEFLEEKRLPVNGEYVVLKSDALESLKLKEREVIEGLIREIETYKHSEIRKDAIIQHLISKLRQ